MDSTGVAVVFHKRRKYFVHYNNKNRTNYILENSANLSKLISRAGIRSEYWKKQVVVPPSRDQPQHDGMDVDRTRRRR